MQGLYGLKNALFKVYDKFSEAPMIIAIRQALFISIPFYVIGYIGVILQELKFRYGFLDGDGAERIIFDIIVDISNFAFFSLGIILCMSIVAHYLSLVVKNSYTLQNGGVITAVVNYFIALGISDGRVIEMQYSLISIPTAIVTGLYTAYMFRLLSEYVLCKNNTVSNNDTLGSVVAAIIPPSLAVELIYFAVYYIIMKTTGEPLFLFFYDLFNFDSIAKIKSPSLALILLIIYKQLLMWLGVNSDDFLGPMSALFIPFETSSDFYKEINYFSMYAVASTGFLAFTLAVSIMWFSKYKRRRRSAELGLLPSVFGVGQPVIYSLDTILNPIYFLPFICIPTVNFIILLLVEKTGILPAFFYNGGNGNIFIFSVYFAAYSVPSFFLMLGMSILDIFMFRPFVKMADEYNSLYLSKQTEKIVGTVKECENSGRDFEIGMLTQNLYQVAILLLARLKKAVTEKNNIYMYYQPQTDTNGTCIGAEALIRWNDDEIGFIYPPLIIALAKYGGFLGELETFIFETSAKELSWMEDAGFNGKISINITGESLLRESIVDDIQKVVNKYGVNPNHFWIEITEQDAITTSLLQLERLHALKKSGFHLLIDDFGMGHTSLQYLRYDVFDGIKLDGSLTRVIVNGAEAEADKAIIENITELARKFSLYVVAEFVETEEQKKALENLGVNYFQGYLISRPVDADDFEEYIYNNSYTYKEIK